MARIQHLWIPGRFPGLNELVDAKSHRDRVTGWDGYWELKKQLEHRVVLCARSQHLRPVAAAYFTYLVYEEDRRRDPSNVFCGAVKIVEDALQKAGIIKNDGWKQVLGFAGYWEVDKHDPGIAVFLSTFAVLDKGTALFSDQQARKKNARVQTQAKTEQGTPDDGSDPETA